MEVGGRGRNFDGMPTAIVTGASRGLGLALARALAERGWRLVIDAREEGPLNDAAGELARVTHVVALAGDVADAEHRASLIAAAGGRIDLLVNNASVLGPSPQPALADYPLDTLEHVYRVNVLAPLALVQLALPLLAAGARIVNVSSDAAVEPYEGWGGYGSAKAALDQLTAILAVERHDLRVYAVDPGDMNTRMHQEAFPGEDISDRPPPESSVPGLLALIEGELPSGRYQARELAGARRERALVRAAVAPRGLRAARGPRRGADDGRPGRAARSSTPTSSTSPTTCARATCWSSTRRRRSRRRCPRAGPTARPSTCTSRHPTRATPDRWVVELPPRRAPRARATTETLTLPGGAHAHLLAPVSLPGRLWIAGSTSPGAARAYLDAHGAPIRYAHDPRPARSRTIRRSSPPSPAARRCRAPAGRSPSARWTQLRDRGISVQRIVLHTGVSSQERGERPYPERYRSPRTPPRASTRPAGGQRVIAVGTTVVRALETVATADGSVHAGEGWTSLTVTPERGVRAVDGLLTGWHEPDASHLLMLEASPAAAARTLLRRRARPRLPLARVRGPAPVVALTP